MVLEVSLCSWLVAVPTSWLRYTVTQTVPLIGRHKRERGTVFHCLLQGIPPGTKNLPWGPISSSNGSQPGSWALSARTLVDSSTRPTYRFLLLSCLGLQGCHVGCRSCLCLLFFSTSVGCILAKCQSSTDLPGGWISLWDVATHGMKVETSSRQINLGSSLPPCKGSYHPTPPAVTAMAKSSSSPVSPPLPSCHLLK